MPRSTRKINIRKLCAQRGISVEQLAAKSGVSYPSLTMFQSVGANPRWTTLERICDVLDIDNPRRLFDA